MAISKITGSALGKDVIMKDVATADGSSPTLTLQTGDTNIEADDVLGSINFQAPDEGTGTDAILVAAGIAAVSEGDFSSSNNATKLSFKTGASEAASEKMSLSSGGNLTIISNDAGAGAGPVFKFRRNSASPADNDLIGAIDWTSENSDGDEHDFLNLTARMRDVTAGSEDVAFAFTAYLNGTGREIQSFVNTDASVASMVFNEDSQDIDFRVESNGNENMFKVDGGDNKIYIGHAADQAYDAGFTPAVQIAQVGNTVYGGIGMAHYSNDAEGAVLIFGSSRATSVTGTTIVADGDTLGRIEFQGQDGSDFETGASIFGEVDGTPGADDMPGRLVFKTTADGAHSATERMRITNAGLVGIGSDAPPMKLTVRNGSVNSDVAKFTGDGTGGGLTISTASTTRNDDTVIFKASDAFGELSFLSDTTEVLRLDKDNNVKVGGTNGNPVGNHVSQTIINGTTGMGVHRDGGTPFKLGTDGNREIAIFHIQGADVGSIDVSGSNTSYNTSSDYRLKENVTDLTNGITRLKQLSPKRFNFIKHPDTTLDGFLAHEAQAVVPESATHEKDATRTVTKGVYNSDGIVIFEDIEESDWKTGKEGGQYPSDSTWSASKELPVYQGIDPSKLVALLTAALQEAIVKIETLETKVAALEG